MKFAHTLQGRYGVQFQFYFKLPKMEKTFISKFCIFEIKFYHIYTHTSNRDLAMTTTVIVLQ